MAIDIRMLGQRTYYNPISLAIVNLIFFNENLSSHYCGSLRVLPKLYIDTMVTKRRTWLIIENCARNFQHFRVNNIYSRISAII
jgi:hypothetical protein